MSTNLRRFENRVAVVTGGASGIGRRTAFDLACEGAMVVIGDVADCVRAASELRAEVESRERSKRGPVDESGIQHSEGTVIGCPCDVSSRDDVDALIDTAVERFDGVDILINNAGILITGSLEETTDKIIDSTVDINIKGVLYCSQAAAPHMKKAGYGRIVNVASITGKAGDGSTVPIYGASKGAVISMTRSLARSLGPFGVTVNAVAPHAVMTPLMDYWDAEKRREAAAKIPVGRLGTAEDISSLILFLASEQAGFINGETVNINGGYYMD